MPRKPRPRWADADGRHRQGVGRADRAWRPRALELVHEAQRRGVAPSPTAIALRLRREFPAHAAFIALFARHTVDGGRNEAPGVLDVVLDADVLSYDDARRWRGYRRAHRNNEEAIAA